MKLNPFTGKRELLMGKFSQVGGRNIYPFQISECPISEETKGGFMLFFSVRARTRAALPVARQPVAWVTNCTGAQKSQQTQRCDERLKSWLA